MTQTEPTTLKSAEEIRAHLWSCIARAESAKMPQRMVFGGSRKGRISEREAIEIGYRRTHSIESARGLLKFMGDPDAYGDVPAEFAIRS